METERTSEYLARLEEAFNRLTRYMAAAATEYQMVAPGPMLSASQRIVLRALADRGPCQVSEVANQLGVTLSAATGLVDRLVKAKLSERERDQKDRRVVWVKITDEGTDAVVAAELRRKHALSEVVQNLSQKDLSDLCDILSRVGKE